jgi:hypothetical protein
LPVKITNRLEQSIAIVTPYEVHFNAEAANLEGTKALMEDTAEIVISELE